MRLRLRMWLSCCSRRALRLSMDATLYAPPRRPLWQRLVSWNGLGRRVRLVGRLMFRSLVRPARRVLLRWLPRCRRYLVLHTRLSVKVVTRARRWGGLRPRGLLVLHLTWCLCLMFKALIRCRRRTWEARLVTRPVVCRYGGPLRCLLLPPLRLLPRLCRRRPLT